MTDRSVSIDLQARVSGFVNGINTARRAATSFTAELEKSAKKRQALNELGSAAGKVGLVAAAGLGAAVLAAANFDQAMSNVQAATHETASNMDLLRAAAIKAGAETKFSASEAAAGIENLAKAGVSTKDILGGGLDGALSLAAAGSLEVGDAAEIAATALTQFGLSGADIPHVADLLAAGAGKAQGEVSDMAAALSQGGLVAHSMGLSIEETTGALSAFASAGLIGSDAGTSLKTTIQRLQAPIGTAAKTMKDLNLSAYDGQGKFIGLAKFADQLRDRLKGMTDQQRNAALSTIFGSDAVRAATVLYDQGGKGIQGWINKVDDSGYAAETAALKMDNLKGDLEQLGGSLETALIGAGSGSQGPIRSIVQDLTKAVNGFNQLSPAAQSAATSLLGITAVTGGGLWFTSKVIQGVVSAKGALSELGVQAATSKAALAGIGKGITFVALIQGAAALDDALDHLFNQSLDGSNLQASLNSLSKNRVTGTLADTFGKDLSGVGSSLDMVNNKLAQFNGVLAKFTPGDAKIDDVRKNFDDLDQSLASMVEGGALDEAQSAFNQLSAAAIEQGHSIKDLEKQFPEYAQALREANGEAQGFSDFLFGGLNVALADAGRRSQKTAQRTEQMTKALKDSRDAAYKTATAFFGIGESVDDTKVSLNGWIHDMEKSARALAQFQRNAEKAANKGLRSGLIDALEKAGPAGALRMEQLAGATEAQIRRANRAWGKGQRAVADYTDTIGGVPKSADTRVNVTGITAAEAALNRLARQRIAMVVVRRVGGPATGGGGGRDMITPADGTTVPGPRYPYGDKIAALLAPGEEVISNRHGQADRHRGLLKAINANRMADGGTAGGGGVDHTDKATRRHQHQVESHLKAARKSLGQQVGTLEKMYQTSKDLNQAVQGNFRTDPFQNNSTLQGVLSSLTTDTTNAQGFAQAARRAKKLGLDGSVFQQLLASGNTAVLQSIDSKGDVKALEAAWRARNKATRDLTFGAGTSGRFAGDTLAELRHELAHLRGELKHLGHHVENGARKGTDARKKREEARRRMVTGRAVLP